MKSLINILFFSLILVFINQNAYCYKFVTNGRYITINGFESKILGNKRSLRIFLPESYSSSSRNYPVLYMHDGQNIYYSTNNKMKWNIDKNIDNLVKQNKIEEIIIVGIDNTGERISEYTPTPHGNYGGGKGKLYADFIVNEVKPFIEENFRVLKSKHNTGIAGSSLGGLISLYTALWYPDTFGIVGCISPSFWWDIENTIKNLQSAYQLTNTKIYIDMGYMEMNTDKNKDGIEDTIYTTRVVFFELQKLGIDYPNLIYLEDPKGMHNEITWSERVNNFIIFGFSTQKTLTNKIQKSEMFIFPKEIGLGDYGSFTLNIIFENDLTMSIFNPKFESDVLEYTGNNTFKAVKSGRGYLKIYLENITNNLEVDVLPISSYISILKLNVKSKAKNVKFEVTKLDSIKTNFIIELEKSGDSFVKTITNNKGTVIEGSFILDEIRENTVRKLLLNRVEKEYIFNF